MLILQSSYALICLSCTVYNLSGHARLPDDSSQALWECHPEKCDQQPVQWKLSTYIAMIILLLD